MSRVAQWFQDRVPIDGGQIRELTNEPVPNHMKRWWFALGGTPAYLFIIQIVTGIVLAVYYQPSTETAYESVRYITEEAAFGWYIRSHPQVGRDADDRGGDPAPDAGLLHRRLPQAARAQLDGRHVPAHLYADGTGFTGYSLVYEQLSYWGATVGANIGRRALSWAAS